MPDDTKRTVDLDRTVAQVTKLPRVPAPENARIRGRRLHYHHQEDVRDKIDSVLIVKKLTDHINGKNDLTPTQVASAKILLDRTVATLTATEITKVDALPAEADLLSAIQRIILSNPMLLSTLQQHMPQLIGSGTTDK